MSAAAATQIAALSSDKEKGEASAAATPLASRSEPKRNKAAK
jgi:hypothetical protein